MKSILKDKNNSEKLLNMTSDTLILMDRDGVCVDIAIHNVELWFLKEESCSVKTCWQCCHQEHTANFIPNSRKSCCTEQNPSAIMN